MENKMIYICGTKSCGKRKFITSFCYFLKEIFKTEEYKFKVLKFRDLNSILNKSSFVFFMYDISGCNMKEGNKFLDYFFRKGILFKIILNKIDYVGDWCDDFSHCFFEEALNKQTKNYIDEFYRCVQNILKHLLFNFNYNFKLFEDVFPTSSTTYDGLIDLYSFLIN